MKGLIIKDKITLFKKFSPVTLVILIVLALIILVSMKSTGAIILGTVLPMLVPSSIPITLLSCDEQWKWDRFAIAMPVTRKQIVYSRYVFCSIILLFCSAFALVLNVGAYFILHELSLTLHLVFTGIGFIGGLIYLLLILPANYIWGQNGGTAIVLIFVALASGGTFLLKAANLNITLPTPNQIVMIAVFAIIGLALLVLCSIRVSIWFYTKKHS